MNSQEMPVANSLTIVAIMLGGAGQHVSQISSTERVVPLKVYILLLSYTNATSIFTGCHRRIRDLGYSKYTRKTVHP